MHKDLTIATPSVAGSTELIVLAPIKRGLVPTLESMTYKTRAKLLLKALHSGRKNAHEVQLFRALSDAVERVGVIHSVRVAVIEGNDGSEDKILLSVNFDGAYEAYVRVIWQKSARLLDLIFCNTERHTTGWDHSYADWSKWLREHQVETPFYYGAPGLTRADVTYLRMLENFERRAKDADLATLRIATPSAEAIAWSLVVDNVDPRTGPYAQKRPSSIEPGAREGVRQGLQGLAGIYRLAELYPPGSDDGKLLKRAAHELIPEFTRMLRLLEYRPAIEQAGGARLREAIDWIDDEEALPPVRVKPPLTEDKAPPLPTTAQAGILRAYEGVITHGCLCLLSFDDAKAAAGLLSAFNTTAEGLEPATGKPRWNLSLSFAGLRACGVGEWLLDQLPLEFRQGMAQRAGLLGDIHGNHPQRWQLPQLNWPQAVDHPDLASNPATPRVALEAVHAVIQVRLGPVGAQPRDTDLRPQIGALLRALFARTPGVKPLSVQWLRRLFNATDDVVEHFGYTDGQSQPQFGRSDAWFFPNQVHLGEALLGHPNAAEVPPAFDVELKPLLQDGSFLVVRKLRQDVPAFEQAVQQAVADHAAIGLDPRLVRAKMMGRWQGSAKPLAETTPGQINDFNFVGDENGSQCPLSAHIRRCNPREQETSDAAKVQLLPGGRPARLFRRSLSYVPPVRGGDPGDSGLVFMAYNASIGEQFEVVQRWMTGGNSAGGYSGVSDPFGGVPEAGKSRWFRFEHQSHSVRMKLDGSDELAGDPRPLVRLEWGAYLFAPSLPGIAHLAALAKRTGEGAMAGLDDTALPWSADDGAQQIKALRCIEASSGAAAAADAWKAALEDPQARADYRSASIWAAVRRDYGGLLRIPYGVLVAQAAQVDAVLTNTDGLYSVGGYQKRLNESIGPIFLGLDDGPEYQRQSKACNDAISALTFKDGFEIARERAAGALQEMVAAAMRLASHQHESRWELNLDVRELTDKVLACLVERWFGLSDKGKFFKVGGFNWAWRDDGPALYPGQFNTPSRNTFQPQPGALVEDLARRQGAHLRLRMNQFLQANHKTMGGVVSRAVLGNLGADLDLAGRTIVGAIMGFVPTTEGNLRRIVAEWLRDGTLWQLRARVSANSLADPTVAYGLLQDPIRRAMQLRPVPELVWRTALQPHRLPRIDQQLGPDKLPPTEDVQAGERLILALVSATHQHLQAREPDLMPVFGGSRTAHPAPTHACPGYQAAMGIISGVLSAIVDAPVRLRPGATGILAFEGDLAPPAARQPAVKGALGGAAGLRWMKGGVNINFTPSGWGGRAVDRGRLLAWGDSWFKLNHPLTNDEWDLRWALAELGYETSGFAIHSRSGLTLREMAAAPARRDFYALVRKLPPRAVLIDGGGNDVHALHAGLQPLAEILRPDFPAAPFRPGAVASFIHDRLAGQLDTVLKNVIDATEGKLPIFVHGYDHPLPDGTGFPLTPGPWLQPIIKGIHRYGADHQGATIMKELIDELNLMIGKLAQTYAGQQVHHLKLTGLLAQQPGYELPGGGYRRYWLNELHPSIEGYRVLARAVHAQMEAVFVKLAQPKP